MNTQASSSSPYPPTHSTPTHQRMQQDGCWAEIGAVLFTLPVNIYDPLTPSVSKSRARAGLTGFFVGATSLARGL